MVKKNFSQRLVDLFSRQSTQSTATRQPARPALRVFRGYPTVKELNLKLGRKKRYETWQNMVNNNWIVAAAVSKMVAFVGNSRITLQAAQVPEDRQEAAEEARERLHQAIFVDPQKSIRWLVKKLTQAQLYGFAVVAWKARFNEDGQLTLDDYVHIPQSSIERYLLDANGNIRTFVQRDPTDPGRIREIEIPRWRCIHMVNDNESDHVEGWGLFRKATAEHFFLEQLRALERFAQKKSQRGIIKFKYAAGEIETRVREMVKNGDIHLLDKDDNPIVDVNDREAEIQKLIDDEIEKITQYQVEFAEAINKNDATVYIQEESVPHIAKTTLGDERATTVPQYDTDFIDAGTVDLPSLSQAIKESEYRLAGIFGAVDILTGRDQGSFALSENQTNNFLILVDDILNSIEEAIYQDLVKPFALFLGIDSDLVPTVVGEIVQSKDMQTITQALVNMVQAGHQAAPTDPMWNFMRGQLGVPLQPREDQDRFATEAEEMRQETINGMRRESNESSNSSGSNSSGSE